MKGEGQIEPPQKTNFKKPSFIRGFSKLSTQTRRFEFNKIVLCFKL